MTMSECVSTMSAELRSRVAGLRQTGEGEYVCTMDFDPAFRGFEGHFEGNPIVPGVCLIQAARTAAEAVIGKALVTRSISNCRFRRPVPGGGQITVRIKLEKSEDGLWTVKADMSVGGQICTQLKLKAAEP